MLSISHLHGGTLKHKIAKVNSKIRKDSTNFNNNRIDEAGDENEVWKITKDIINPQTETEWSIVF